MDGYPIGFPSVKGIEVGLIVVHQRLTDVQDIVFAHSATLVVMGLGETLHLSSHKYTGPLSIVKIAKVCTVMVVKGEKCLRK